MDMYFYTLVNIIVTIVFIVAVLFVAFRIFAWKQGNEEIVMLPKRRTQFEVEDISFNQVTLVSDIPFVNKGRQNGTIMDLYPRSFVAAGTSFDPGSPLRRGRPMRRKNVMMGIGNLLSSNRAKAAPFACVLF